MIVSKKNAPCFRGHCGSDRRYPRYGMLVAAVLILFGVGSGGRLYSEEEKAGNADGSWYFQGNNGAPEELAPDVEGTVSASFELPNSAMIFFERDRRTFRSRKEDFQKEKLSVEVKAESSDGKPVKGNFFVKDKDGLWFQSRHTFSLSHGVWRKIEVDTRASSQELVPDGHFAAWSCLNAAAVYSAGVNVFGPESRKIKLYCRGLTRSGERAEGEFYVADLSYPGRGHVNKMLEGRFELSREYFNPFDAGEIQVDVQFISPSLKETTVPAFFSVDYARKLSFNREIGTPTGKAHWAFRFTPYEAGVHKFRIAARDSSGKPGGELTTRYFEINVEAAKNPGFVRVSPGDQRYFEFSTGEFFYPIGFNIHSVKDTRSEDKLNLGYRPDKGTFSYDEYFSAMAASGVNAVEIWMAAWSFAIEWTSAHPDYCGLGRYNLFNAWRLDHVLGEAAKKGIYVHLVLDNHGKLSSHSDPEWDNSPHNKNTPFAAADGAMLELPADFFTSEEAKRHYLNRNRYIAARWGAFTNIFGVELWSEVNLITGHDEIYNNDKSTEWHRMASQHFTALDQGKHLLTTHTCGDYNNPLAHRKLYELPEIAYVVGDAYRDKTPFVEHMLEHTSKLKEFKKPLLITEYGGTSQAGNFSRLEADLHAGLWSSFFCEQAGTPFLWWHDFIHEKDKYPHFRGFSLFMKGIDPRGGNFSYVQLPVSSDDGVVNDAYSCLAAGNQKEHYGWVFKKTSMESYPENIESLDSPENLIVALKGFGEGAELKIDFIDTVSGEIVRTGRETARGEDLKIKLPTFKMDVAFKILREPATPAGNAAISTEAGRK